MASLGVPWDETREPIVSDDNTGNDLTFAAVLEAGLSEDG